MKTYIISQTDDEIIEVPLNIHQFLISQTSVTFKADSWTVELVLAIILKELQRKGYYNQQSINYSSLIPVIHQGFTLFLKPPFDAFSIACNWIGLQDSLNDPEEYEIILDEIGTLYSEQTDLEGKIYTAIFHKPINRIKGYCAHITDTTIDILMWAYDEYNIGDLSL